MYERHSRTLSSVQNEVATEGLLCQDTGGTSDWLKWPRGDILYTTALPAVFWSSAQTKKERRKKRALSEFRLSFHGIGVHVIQCEWPENSVSYNTTVYLFWP